MRTSSSQSKLSTGAAAWASTEKVSSELFTLTYGALVRQARSGQAGRRLPLTPWQLVNDSEGCVEDVNAQLDKLCV